MADVGKVYTTKDGKAITILRHRKSRTFPFFDSFYLYDVSIEGLIYSIRCNEFDNLINGKKVVFVFD